MSDFPKIKTNVPKQIKEDLEKDAVLFEIYKRNKNEPNMNHFLVTLICNYYHQFIDEINMRREHIQRKLEGILSNSVQCAELSESILNDIFVPSVQKKSKKKRVALSIKPTNASDSVFEKINAYLTGRYTISEFYCRMLISYCQLPMPQRERIIFSENYHELENAITAKRCVAFSTIWSSEQHNVAPYKLTIGKDEMFNYLICAQIKDDGKTQEARAYRLNRIKGIGKTTAPYHIDPSIRGYLDRMEQYGPQYAINSDEESCVRLSAHGKTLFNRIYHGRPRYERIDGDCYFFYCSPSQLFLYFRKFGKEAEIISPPELRDMMITFHTEAIEAYKEKNDE